MVDPLIAKHRFADGERAGEGEGESVTAGPGTMPPLVHAATPPATRLASANAESDPVSGFIAQKG